MSEVKPLKPTRHDHFLVIDSNVEPDGNPLEKVLFNERREGEATERGEGAKREKDEIHQKRGEERIIKIQSEKTGTFDQKDDGEANNDNDLGR